MTNRRPVASLVATIAVAAVGCDNDPVKNRPQAIVAADAQAVAAGGPPPGSKAQFFDFSPADSSINFVGAKVTKKHDGSFGAFKGKIGLVGGDPIFSAVTVEIETASLTADSDKLAVHLKSADFLDVANFPKATFSSTTIRPGEGASKYNVTGRLGLHGVSKPITFPATIRIAPAEVTIDAEFGVNRKDFGIVYPGAADDLIKDDVLIKLALHAKPMKPAGAGPSDAQATD